MAVKPNDITGDAQAQLIDENFDEIFGLIEEDTGGSGISITVQPEAPPDPETG